MSDGAVHAAAVPASCAAVDGLDGEARVQVQRVLQLNADLRAHYQLAEDNIVTVRASFDRVTAGEPEPLDAEVVVAPIAPTPPVRTARPVLIMATLACALVGITTGLIVSLQAATPSLAPITTAPETIIKSAGIDTAPAEKLEDYGQTIYAARFSAAPPAERMCLARAVYYEARGEAMDGQIAVAQVVLNRARSKQWPSTICGVVNQGIERGEKCQFSFACFSHLIAPNGPLWEQAKSVAEEALAGRGWLRELVEATHYHTTGVAPIWRLNLTPINTIGAHVFYRGNEGVVVSSKDAEGYRAAAAAQTVQTVHAKIAAVAKVSSGVKIVSLADEATTTVAGTKIPRPKAATPDGHAPKRTAAHDSDWKTNVFGQ
jgi:hypothetical protein